MVLDKAWAGFQNGRDPVHAESILDGWSKWLALGGGFTSGPHAAVTDPGRIVVMTANRPDRLLKWVLTASTGAQSAWSELATPALAPVGSAGVSNLGSGPEVIAPDANSIVVLGRTTKGALMYTRWTSGGNWSRWATTSS